MISTMFEVPIINLKIDNWQHKKEKLIEVLRLVNSTINQQGTIYTDYFSDQQQYSYIKNIEDIFSDEISTICTLLKQPMYVNNCWFEVAKLNNYHGIHNHGSVGYSAVCYMQYKKELHSSIRLVSPFYNFLTGDCIDYSPEISEGSLICFPSAVLHYTEPNLSDVDRIVVSFNLRAK
ncbi:MAG: hypothetical protein EBR82_48905 [Caulobacteraceae bacterium]|nr:hypothetical protein [Caulobacteraceae bacterium]